MNTENASFQHFPWMPNLQELDKLVNML